MLNLKPVNLILLKGLLGIVMAASALWVVYSQAYGMAWQFDDYINLNRLAQVSTHAGLLDFVFGGVAGPMGRSISLATFVANYADWPNNPWGFSELNLLLHVINSVLVYLLFVGLLERMAHRPHTACILAALISLIWLIMPVHASSILMPVQRMTQVSAFFTLLTLYVFFSVRTRWEGVPSLQGVLVLCLVLVVGTVLSVLGKENGAVTPALAGLIELFFFSRNNASRKLRLLWYSGVCASLLAVPVAIFIYVLGNWSDIQGSFVYFRGRTMAEHIATQFVISWEYVRQICLPRAAAFGPYHDGHVVYSWNMWQPQVALLAWLGVVIFAVSLMRRENPSVRLIGKLIFFAILWFFACHQIESTLIPLELYFEHRNYLAALGFCLIFVAPFGLIVISNDGRKVAALAVLGIVALQVFALQQVTSLWGQPMLANEMWAINHPTSTRATQAFANTLLQQGFKDAALKLTDEFIEKQSALDVAIQFFPKHCEQGVATELRNRFNMLSTLNAKPGGIPTGLAGMGRAIREGQCEGITLQDYNSFLMEILKNPSVHWNPRVRHHIEYEMALTQLKLEDIAGYVLHARQAFLDFPSLGVAQAVALTLFQHGELAQALTWIDDVLANAPNVMLAEAWKEQLANLRDALLNVQNELGDIHRSDKAIAPLH